MEILSENVRDDNSHGDRIHGKIRQNVHMNIIGLLKKSHVIVLLLRSRTVCILDRSPPHTHPLVVVVGYGRARWSSEGTAAQEGRPFQGWPPKRGSTKASVPCQRQMPPERPGDSRVMIYLLLSRAGLITLSRRGPRRSGSVLVMFTTARARAPLPRVFLRLI